MVVPPWVRTDASFMFNSLLAQCLCDKKTGLRENANFCYIMDMHANDGYCILYGIMLLAKHP